MTHLDYTALFQGYAERHYQIRHGVEVDGVTRVSFFRMNDEEEGQQAIATGIDYPCMVLADYFGRLRGDGGPVSDVLSPGFEIRVHVERRADFAEVDAAHNICKRIGFEIIASLLQEIDSAGRCGPFESLNANSIRYQFSGPVNNNDFACQFTFEAEDTAFNFLTADLSTIFPEP